MSNRKKIKGKWWQTYSRVFHIDGKPYVWSAWLPEKEARRLLHLMEMQIEVGDIPTIYPPCSCQKDT